jgi:hypothetical protein
MKRTLLIFFAFFVLNFVWGQKNQNLPKPLSWNNFKEVSQPQNNDAPFYLAYKMKCRRERTHFHDTTIIRYRLKCQLNPQKSWVLKSAKTPNALEYNQVIWDIVNIECQKFDNSLKKEVFISDTEIERRAEIVKYDIESKVASFKSISKERKDSIEIRLQAAKNAQEVVIFAPRPMPNFRKREFGCGLNVVVGKGFFTQSLKENIYSPYFWGYGFDFAKNRNLICVNGSVGYTKVKDFYRESPAIWITKENLNFTCIDLSYGYALVDNAKHKVTPFLGIGLAEISLNSRDSTEKTDKLYLLRWNAVGGINYDFKFRKNLRLGYKITHSSFQNFLDDENNGFKEGNSFTEYAIRTRLYVTKANFQPDLNGFCINLSLGFSLFTRSLANASYP